MKNGKIIFPVLEPFGKSLKAQFNPDEVGLIDKYVFDKLYSSTQTDALQLTGKDKFFLKGSFQSGVGGDVSLPFGVDGKSVTKFTDLLYLIASLSIGIFICYISIVNKHFLPQVQRQYSAFHSVNLFSTMKNAKANDS